MNKTVVILNPSASTASNYGAAVQRLANSHNCVLQTPQNSPDMVNAVQLACENGSPRVIVAGGDGTISHVVNVLLPRFSSIPVGVIPLGTGNDLARSLSLPLDNIDLAFEIATTHPPVAIDVIHTRNDVESYFVNAATGGFGGEVTATLSAANKHLWGPFAYWMSAMSKLVDMQGYELELNLDGEVTQHRVYGIACANGRYVGGGFPIAATALLNDGLLDVIFVPEVPKLELLASGVNFMLGWQSGTSPVVVRRAKRAQVRAVPRMLFSMDGEALSVFDATFQVIPGALQFVAGEKPALIPH